MRRFSFKQRVLIGLAVLPENIHIVQLSRSKKTVYLQRVLSIAIPPDIVVDGRINQFEVVTTLLTKWVQAEGLQAAQVAVSVPVSMVKMQRMLIPSGLPASDIEAEVMAEATRLLSAKHERITLDYQVKRTARAEEQAVIFAATRDNYHERYVACLREAGLLPAIIDVDICALLRGARLALKNTLTDNDKIAVLSLHDTYGVIVAEQAGELLFHQHWDTRQTTTLAEWLEWCCQAYRQAGISTLQLTGQSSCLEMAVTLVARHWRCQFYQADPLSNVPSALLLACGLALREPLLWLN